MTGMLLHIVQKHIIAQRKHFVYKRPFHCLDVNIERKKPVFFRLFCKTVRFQPFSDKRIRLFHFFRITFLYKYRFRLDDRINLIVLKQKRITYLIAVIIPSASRVFKVVNCQSEFFADFYNRRFNYLSLPFRKVFAVKR